MKILIVCLTALSALAHAAPETLLLDLRNNGQGRAMRALRDCQWVETDLTQNFIPDMLSVGMGSVLVVRPKMQIKMLAPSGKPRWQEVASLPAYKDNNPIIQRFGELETLHNKRGLFYETPEHISECEKNGTGFALKPGDVLISEGDPGLLRYLFDSPVVEFSIAEVEVIDGVKVYKPSETRGAIALESLERSASVIYLTNVATMAMQRKMKADAKKAKACGEEIKSQ